MLTEELLNEIKLCITEEDYTGIHENLHLFISSEPNAENASMILAELITDQFTFEQNDLFLRIFQEIIKEKPKLAEINYPDNYLFTASLITGSKKLYDCYIKDFFLKSFSELDTKEIELKYSELLEIAEDISDHFNKQYEYCIKGQHYKGADKLTDKSVKELFISTEDYKIMEDFLKKYNTLIGRGMITEDLRERAATV